MHEHVLGHGQVRRHQHGRPEDRVELEDVLADHVIRRRPEAIGQVLPRPRIPERGVVIEERVEPHVEHVPRIPGNRHAPLQALARQRDVLEAL